MKKLQKAFLRPPAKEQVVLEHFTVREVQPEEIPRFNEYFEQEHYLKSEDLKQSGAEARAVQTLARACGRSRSVWSARDLSSSLPKK